MKKVLSILLIGALVSSLICVGVSASNNNEKKAEISIEEYANLDLKDVADAETREKVLEARKKIIFDNEWVADGYTGYVMDMTTGEIIRDLPAFSEVFPGWELPVEEITVSKQPTEAEPYVILSENATRVSSSDWIYIGGSNYYLTQATDVPAAPYAYFYWDPY